MCRYEWKDFNEDCPSKKIKTDENPIFGKNLNIISNESSTKDTSDQINLPCGPINCIIFFGVHVYNMSNAVIKLILAIQSLCGNLIDSIIQRYICVRIVRSLTPSKISNLIELLDSK